MATNNLDAECWKYLPEEIVRVILIDYCGGPMGIGPLNKVFADYWFQEKWYEYFDNYFMESLGCTKEVYASRVSRKDYKMFEDYFGKSRIKDPKWNIYVYSDNFWDEYLCWRSIECEIYDILKKNPTRIPIRHKDCAWVEENPSPRYKRAKFLRSIQF